MDLAMSFGRTEIVISRRNYLRRLGGACTMLVLLGVPWIFSAFGVVDPAGNKHLENLQAVFNVSDLYMRYSKNVEL